METTLISLSSLDFNLSSPSRITTTNTSCLILLFYNLIDNPLSAVAVDVFGKVSRSVAGPVFGFVDLRANPDIGIALNKLASDTDNPFNKFAYHKVPFIINYRGGWPIEIYNGSISDEEQLRNFALNVSCLRPRLKQVEVQPTTESSMVPKVELISAQMELQRCQEDNKQYIEIINRWKDYADNQAATIRMLQNKLRE